ncbi:MAG: glycoside hydrolase family 26 protein [Prevotella sp.]
MACIVSFAGKKSPAQNLINRLASLQHKGIMIGQQDALFYGTTWKWEYGRSDMKDVCGDYPAVLGCELSGIENGKERNIDGVPFNKMREQIIDFAQKGGIVTLSWHADNPVNGENAWNVDVPAVADCLPGGAQHRKMQLWISRVIDFINSLRDANGKPIPVIFRPLHEMSGNWFWWGAKHCTADEFKSLYQMIVKQFRKAKVEHVVWSYSPGADAADTPEHFFSFYPGDKYVDLLGVDIYQNDTGREFISTCQKELKIMQDYASAHHKLYAITEAGYRNTPDPNWFTHVLRPALAGFNPCYVLLWRNAWDMKEENFGPAPEKSCAEDFRKFYSDKNTLFLKDINK